jgi:DNA repair protein RadC
MASGAIIAHNHPSGNLEPSNDDTNLTGALSFLLQVAGAKLMDHIIMTKNQYFSFHENDRMPSFTVQEVNDHFRQILP